MRRRTFTFLALALAPLAIFASAAPGCGTASAPNPFVPVDSGSDASNGDAGDGGDAGAGGAGGGDAGTGGAGGGISFGTGGSDAGDMYGGPCLDDGQCTADSPCAFKSCDKTVGRCHYVPDDSKCQDGVYCNGREVCDLNLGCVAGAPVVCSKGDACITGTCVEKSQSCVYAIKDSDGDGDGDWHCDGGHDCNDMDPNVSSLVPEVCANGIDDNCNHLIDEKPCVTPANSTCLDPLQISTSGTYSMNTLGSPNMYPTSCGLGSVMGSRESVAAVILPAGPPMDIEVTATSTSAQVSVAVAGQCGVASTEIACGPSFASAVGGQVARVRARALGSASQQTAYPVYVQTSVGSAVALDVQFLPPEPAPTNLTCGTATPLTPGTPSEAEILGGMPNLGTACATSLNQLVYSITLASAADLTVYATSTDGLGSPIVSLRDPGCSLPTDEITCIDTGNVRLYRQNLAAGTYYVAVSASAPTNIDVTADIAPPTTPAPDQFCTGAPLITPNKTIPVALSTHEAVTNLGCLPGAVDAAYDLELASASDVIVVERIASGDTGAVGLASPACTPGSALICQAGSPSPVRGSARDVPAGSYRVIAQSLQGEDVQLTAFVRDAVPPTLVAFGNGCSQAFAIPPTGGFFQGNTANSSPNFPAGCDVGGVAGNSAPDQLLSLTLSKTQRVILDMNGSGYNTIIDVRQGPSCPGTEVLNGCAIGFPPWHSFLDLTLEAGVYYLQVDGYDGSDGPWFLDVRVVDP